MYLYIFEGGEIRQHCLPPSRGDLEQIENGVLEVLHVCNDGSLSQIDETGEMKPVEEAKIENYDGEYHVP